MLLDWDWLPPSVITYYRSAMTSQMGELIDREWSCCQDHFLWLDAMQAKYQLSSRQEAFRCVINHANLETAAAKRMIFTELRCFRCTQSSMGGTKHAHTMGVYPHQLTWLTNVCDRCKHASVDKTVRIMLGMCACELRHEDSETNCCVLLLSMDHFFVF